MRYRAYIIGVVLSLGFSAQAAASEQPEEMSFSPPPSLPMAAHSWEAYPFNLKYADGRTLTSDQLKGKMVFINAWATWCSPCKPSLPKFSALYRKNIGNPYIKVLSVHLSDRYGRFDNAADYLASKQLYYPVLQDPEGKLVDTIEASRPSSAVPHYVLMDGDGKVLRRYGEINDMVIRDVQGQFNAHSRAMRKK